MKVSETAKLIKRYGELLTRLEHPCAGDINHLLTRFNGWSNKTMANYLKQAKLGLAVAKASAQSSEKDNSLTRLIGQLKAMFEFTAPLLKKTAATDLAGYIDLFESYSDSGSLKEFLQQLDEALGMTQTEIIQNLSENLNKATGDEIAFEMVYDQLMNADLKKDDILKICRKVYGDVPTSTSRTRALELIRKPHDARIHTRRGINAMQGHSAA